MATPSTSIAAGTGAGTGATAALINGTDSNGTIVIEAGIAPAPGSIVARITYGEFYEKTPTSVSLLPANAAAAALAAGTVYVLRITLTAGVFEIMSTAVPLVAGVAYEWFYQVQF